MENTKKCPYCGEEILAVAKKCKHCGEWLTENTQKKEQKTCPVCGETIDADVTVCPYCNENIGQDAIDGAASGVVLQTTAKEEIYNENKDIISDYDTDEPGFIEHYYIDVFFKHYADFQGSISRKQFWMAYLFYAISYIAVYGIDGLIGLPILSTVYMLGTIVPAVAYAVRRMHDTGKSGWWILITFVPLIGPIWLLVLLCQKGKLKDTPVQAKQTDWIVLAIIVLVSVIGISKGLRNIDKKINYFLNGIEDDISLIDTTGVKTDQLNTAEYGTLVATSTSGKYEYYLRENDTHLYQKDTETGALSEINMEEKIPDVDITIGGIEDYTAYGNKLVFISNNGSTGRYNACDAFYLNLDDLSWNYIAFALNIQFNDDKTALKTSSPTDETFEDFEEKVIALDDLGLNKQSSSRKNEIDDTQTTQPSETNEDRIFDVVEEMPSFPGGQGELMAYLSTNIEYPVVAKENGVQGRVICTFVVERNGSVTDVKVIKSVDPSLDKEAVRVIKSMPHWIPGKQNGATVRVKFTLPIIFRL